MNTTPVSTESCIQLQIAVREEWSAKKDLRTVKLSTYTDFTTHVMSVVESKSTSDHPAVDDLLKTLISPEYGRFRQQDILAAVKKNTYGRTYRLTRAIHDLTVPSDNRLLSLFQHLSRSSSSPFPWQAFINGFFTNIPQLPSSVTRKAKTDQWGTSHASLFEKFLLIALFAEYFEVAGSRNNPQNIKKRRKSSGNSTTNSTNQLLPINFLKDFKRKEGSGSQRAGKVVQTIVKAWNCFAQSCHFKDANQMFIPYLIFNDKPSQLTVIETRDAGYMPRSAASTMDLSVRPVLLPSETFPGVTALPGRVDTFLRTMAFHFLNDLRKHVFSSGLYVEEGVQLRTRLTGYLVHGDIVPRRFNSFEEEDLLRLRAAKRLQDGIVLNNRNLTAAGSSQGNEHGNNTSDNAEQQNEAPNSDNGNGNGGEQQQKRARTGEAAFVHDWFQQTSRSEVSHAESNRRKLARQKAQSEKQQNQGADAIVAERATIRDFLSKFNARLSSKFTDLQYLLEDIDFDHEFNQNTQLLLLDPPYNVRRNAGRDDSDYDVFTDKDMDEAITTIDSLLRPGGHAIIFCSIQQFPIWESKLRSHVSTESDEEIRPTSRNGTFMVDKVPMVFVNHPQNNNNNPAFNSCSLQSTAEFAVHIKKNGLAYSKEYDMVNYMPFNYVLSSFPATKNVLDNVPALTPGETVMKVVKTSDGQDKLRKLRSEQKPLALMMELISRFTQPGDIVCDFVAGTFSTSTACFMLPKHRIFIGCEKDADCFKIADEKVINRFAEFVTDPTSVTDIQVPDDVLQSCARVFAWSNDRPLLDPSWMSPPGLPPFQRFPRHIMSFISGLLMTPRFITDHFNSPINEWPPSIKQRFDQIPTNQLLQVEAAAFNLVLAPSRIKHPRAGTGVFAAKTFDPDDIVCYYYGTMVYNDLESERSKTKRYGDQGTMGVSAQRFRDYAFQIKTSGASFNAVQNYRYGDRSVFVVPPPFCVGSYINDYRYEEGDEDYEAAKDEQNPLPDKRVPNVRVYQQTHPLSRIPPLLRSDFLYVKAIDRITQGEELLMDYGRHVLSTQL